MNTRPWWLLCATLAAGAAPAGIIHAQDLNAARRELADIEADAEQMVRLELRRARLRSPTHVEERLTDGELFYRLQDYLRAAVIFTDIVDNYPDHPAAPDATFLLADSLFRAGDYLGARTQFRKVLERSEQKGYQPYVQRALGRLIEVAIHVRDFTGVDEYFDRLSKLPPSEVEAATAYFRAKYLYNKAVPYEIGRRSGPITEPLSASALEEARVAFEAVSPDSPYYSQARYFIGVIYTLRGQYPQAIEAFKRVLAAKVTTEQQVEIAELANLALGRVYYEAGQLTDSVDAYQRVPRTSVNFDVALYESAWAYIRMGDGTRAEQALEVLAIATPESRHIPDAKLLRGNLLLREGRFTDSEEVFGEVSDQFQPIRDELSKRLASHPDPRGYFRELVQENMSAFDVDTFLPSDAQRWSEPGPEMDRAMGTLEDLSQARQLVRETEAIVHRLGRALQAENRVNIFSDLRMHRERTVTLRNRLSQVRRMVIAAEEKALKGVGSAELTAVRARRRELEQRLGAMPRDTETIQSINDKGDEDFLRLQKELSRLEIELMGLEARIVAIDRFTADAFTDPGQLDGLTAIRTELETQRAALKEYSESLRMLTLDVEAGRMRVGVGDERFKRDDELRKAYDQAVEQERQLLAQLGGGSPAEIDALFSRMARVEQNLNAHDARVDEVVAERAAQMETVLSEESVNLDGYRNQLASLEGSSEEVIGGIAYQSYLAVQKRFYDLVLRSDVGTVDVAWARREEHRMRVENLTKGRNAALGGLDAEFAEIMDQQGSKP